MFSSDCSGQKVKIKGSKARRSAFRYYNKYLKPSVHNEKMFIVLFGPDVSGEAVFCGDSTQGNNVAHFVAEKWRRGRGGGKDGDEEASSTIRSPSRTHLQGPKRLPPLRSFTVP